MFYEKKILLVDDSNLIRILLLKILNQAGYQNVDTAEDGLEAIKKIDQKKYDMVCSDFDMPKMNGKELVETIKKNYTDILVIVLSAQAERKTVVDLMRMADNYIVKDELDSIKKEVIFIIGQTFEKDQLRKDNIRLLNELKLRDEKMQSELSLAKYMTKEINIREDQCQNFNIEIYNRQSNIIGGDFFTTKTLSQKRTAVILADISGHGIPGALLLFGLKFLVNDIMKNDLPTDKAMYLLNKTLQRYFPQGMYATVSYLIIDEEKNTLAFTNSFQNPIIFVSKDAGINLLNNSAVKLLGISEQDEAGFQITEIPVASGDRFFLFTDGLLEARAKHQKEFYGSDRLLKLLKMNNSIPLKQIIRVILEDVNCFSNNNIDDDVTLIGIEKK
ncbi:MAG: hypothetical protein A2Y41_12275 [Spirochaetes bacterium GWB1_36_13]|nr:MAG: hypothetical protein A2Y41_12275 [Spirochaetes bacterium GWB1_36_13]